MKTAAGTSSIIIHCRFKADVNNQTYLDLDHINRPTITKSLQRVSKPTISLLISVYKLHINH